MISHPFTDLLKKPSHTLNQICFTTQGNRLLYCLTSDPDTFSIPTCLRTFLCRPLPFYAFLLELPHIVPNNQYEKISKHTLSMMQSSHLVCLL